jgi:membrane protease YdiL (CAAX protease family)
MEANLVGDGVAKPQRTFPYSNWGPWAAVLGVLVALAVGVFFSVPALLLGAQDGKIEARFPPDFKTSASFDKGDATAIAVDPETGRLYSDHGEEVRVFGARGEEIPAAKITGIEGSQGLAFDPRRSILVVSQHRLGNVGFYATRGGVARHIGGIDRSDLLGELFPHFTPERMAVSLGGLVYAIDTGDDVVVGTGLPRVPGLVTLDGSKTPAGAFDFGSKDNDIAVDSHRGPGFGDVFVLSGKGDGTVWAFSRAHRFLWELTPDEGDEFAALTVDSRGTLWIAEPGGDIYPYPVSNAFEGGAPERLNGKIAAGDEVSALAFSGGHLFVARELDDSLSTLGNVLSQIATALGFLLVPMALAAMRGAKGPREIFARLGLRAFRPSALKWMGLTVVLYLAFNVFYSAVITEPHQQDIAKGFGAIPIQILLIVVAAPVSEEICFRGMLFGGLREKLPRVAAALICGLIFGALHAITGISAVPPLVVFGFLLALLYERTGSIVPGMLLHMLNNIVALASQ